MKVFLKLFDYVFRIQFFLIKMCSLNVQPLISLND